MRTVITETKVYKFEELSEKSQQKAIEKYCDINVDYDWWQWTYDDAERIGLKITEFDLDRNRYAKGEFINSALETAHTITEEHGDHCETWRTAQDYLVSRDALVKKYSDGIITDRVTEDNEYDFDQDCDDLDMEFLKSLCEDYSIILQQEYEYLTSDEQIKEMLIANEYEFTEEGIIF